MVEKETLVVILFGIVLLVVFVSGSAGIVENLQNQVPSWALVLIVALLGLGVLGIFKKAT